MPTPQQFWSSPLLTRLITNQPAASVAMKLTLKSGASGITSTLSWMQSRKTFYPTLFHPSGYYGGYQALDGALSKFNEIPEDLKLIFDGNQPIFSPHFFAQHDIFFKIKQVIGLKNEDPVSAKYRPLKQIIERLNRTFKRSYRPTNGFGSEDGSVSFVTLWVAYFNFLRPTSSLEKRVPARVPSSAGFRTCRPNGRNF